MADMLIKFKKTIKMYNVLFSDVHICGKTRKL